MKMYSEEKVVRGRKRKIKWGKGMLSVKNGTKLSFIGNV